MVRKSEFQGVDLVRGRRGLGFNVPESILADHKHGFDTGNDDASAAKGLESQHGACDPFNGPMVLFDDVVEMLRLAEGVRDFV